MRVSFAVFSPLKGAPSTPSTTLGGTAGAAAAAGLVCSRVLISCRSFCRACWPSLMASSSLPRALQSKLTQQTDSDPDSPLCSAIAARAAPGPRGKKTAVRTDRRLLLAWTWWRSPCCLPERLLGIPPVIAQLRKFQSDPNGASWREKSLNLGNAGMHRCNIASPQCLVSYGF